MKKLLIVSCCVVLWVNHKAQRVANYVSNGSFEEYYDCVGSLSIMKVKHWLSIDSVSLGGLWASVCNGAVPAAGNSVFQYPRSGEAYIFPIFYYLTTLPFKRAYPKNRLKSTLQAGKTYCVKFYVNIENGSPYGIDGFGAYFGGSEIDTITKCNEVLSYITPQVQNPQGNIITDTLNWIPITGTFTANGTEKYLLLGNFLSDDDTDTLMINPTHLPAIWTEVSIDDVSCIEVDLPAYAGRDTTILIGDSVYIGRENDFAIDSGCVWYKLPSTTAIDTISGMWVKPPIGTHTYVVRQELECSSLKWDTVVVKVTDGVGIDKLKIENEELRIYPNPANDLIKIESSISNEELDISIIDITGRAVLNKKAEVKNHITDIELNLANGIYILKITNKQQKTISKKLVIAK